MNVLILGSGSSMGPHVVRALEEEHTLRLADVEVPSGGKHETCSVDLTNPDQVMAAAEGMDAIVNLTVVRNDRQLAFDVCARGCYHMMCAAVRHGIRRVINTGPHNMVQGPDYTRFDYDIDVDVPPHPGDMLYALSKAIGGETCRVFAENHDIHVIQFLFFGLANGDETSLDETVNIFPFLVSWSDAGQAFRCALRTDLSSLPSRFEVFSISAPFPHGQYRHGKAARLLGWEPVELFERCWRRRC